MTIDELREQGYLLTTQRTYAVHKTPRGQYVFSLNSAAIPDGQKYYQAVDLSGNILLIRSDNLDLT